jgi:mediator of RNA polymerase II transcription subunit 16
MAPADESFFKIAPRLIRLEPIVMNKVVTGVNSVRMGTAICFSFSDGTVEYRDRATMNELWTEINLDRINSIHEAGFAQGGEPSCKRSSVDQLKCLPTRIIGLQTAISPTTCSIVQMCEDGSMKWHGVTYSLGDPTSMNSGMY